jgi:hypothetical protein
MPTPVLSPRPATPVAPETAQQAGLAGFRGRDRLSHPPPPWTLEDLVGTRLSQPLHRRARHRHPPARRAHGACHGPNQS